MSTNVDSTGTKLVHSLRYRDIGAAIDWLCTAFGFVKHRVVTGGDGTILQAQLTFCNDIIMLLPVHGSDLDTLPEEIGGAEMQRCYFIVDDADLHHRTAKAAGAEILDIKQYHHGGRGYSCRDPEGHIWNFDTCQARERKPAYDRWIRKSVYRKSEHPTSLVGGTRFAASLRDKLDHPLIIAAIVAAVVAAATVGWMLVALPQPGARLANTAHHRGALPASEPTHAKSMAFREIAEQQGPVEADERAGRRAPELAREPSVEEAAERAAQQTTELDQERSTKDAAERKRLAKTSQDARVEKETAKRAGREARKQLVVAPRAIEPAKDLRQFAERNAEPQFWDCLPSPPTGHIVCQVSSQSAASAGEKKPAPSAVVSPAVQKVERSALQPTKDLRQPPEQNADAQFWDCLPSPPTGQIVCRPIIGQGKP